MALANVEGRPRERPKWLLPSGLWVGVGWRWRCMRG